MTILLLRLAGPLQSWGDRSRFVRRETRHEPTKSGVLGLIAAAQGRRRTDPIEDLCHLQFGVRIDQPGKLTRDFQTAQRDGKPMPLSYRYYLADAAFIAAVSAEEALLTGIDDALRNPHFPLYLGRRSCPPAGPVSLGLRAGDLVTAVRAEPWHASRWYRRLQSPDGVDLEFLRDALSANEPGDIVRDEPRSFDPERREYEWRTVVHDEPVHVANPDGRRGRIGDVAGGLEAIDRATPAVHEPMSLLGGA